MYRISNQRVLVFV